MHTNCPLSHITGIAHRVDSRVMPPHPSSTLISESDWRCSQIYIFSITVALWESFLLIAASVWDDAEGDDAQGPDGSHFSILDQSLHIDGCITVGLLDELVIWNHALSAAGMCVISVHWFAQRIPHGLTCHRGA
jgi:hypothetical protein